MPANTRHDFLMGNLDRVGMAIGGIESHPVDVSNIHFPGLRSEIVRNSIRHLALLPNSSTELDGTVV